MRNLKRIRKRRKCEEKDKHDSRYRAQDIVRTIRTWKRYNVSDDRVGNTSGKTIGLYCENQFGECGKEK